MSDLTLVSIVTENYLSRARPFLASLARLESVERVCVCLGFIPSIELRQEFPHVTFRSMPMHWSADGGIMQSGRWLDALPDVDDDRLYLLSDADIIVQRDFTEAELARFGQYDRETFGAGWNAGEGDDLIAEAGRMGMTDCRLFDGCYRTPCWNTGVLVMCGHAWKRVRDLFESRVERFWKVNPHRSRCQWLVCYCLHKLGLKTHVLSGSLHSHGHHGMPIGVNFRQGVAYYGDEVVVFRHAI